MYLKMMPLEVFYKKAVLRRKTPVLEYLFNKVVPIQVLFCEHCEIFKNTYFEDHLPRSASECRFPQQ